jgi:Kef-type K+ transport system membrane component KefB
LNPLIGTLALILIALVGSRFSFSSERIRLGPRLLFRTGTHFLVLGFVLGPSGLGLLSSGATQALFPLLALGLGWVGFHFGLQFDADLLRQFSLRHHAMAVGQALLTLLLFLGGARVLVGLLGYAEAVPFPLLLGAAAAASVSAPAGIAMISSNFLVRGPVRDLIFFIASVDAVVGIIALQATYAFYRPVGSFPVFGGLDQLVLVGIAAGLGVVMGIVFIWLTRRRPTGEELVLFVLGVCAFAAGVALQWGLSPLFVSLVMGTVVANMNRDNARVLRLLERWEKPVYLSFLLVAGALLRTPTPLIVALAGGYALLRFFAKTVAGATVVTTVRLPFPVPHRLGLGLIPQGGITLAMAVSGVLMYSGIRVGGEGAESALFTLIVVGALLSELAGPFLTLQLLRSAGEISPEAEAALARGDARRAEKEALRYAATQARSTGDDRA